MAALSNRDEWFDVVNEDDEPDVVDDEVPDDMPYTATAQSSEGSGDMPDVLSPSVAKVEGPPFPKRTHFHELVKERGLDDPGQASFPLTTNCHLSRACAHAQNVVREDSEQGLQPVKASKSAPQLRHQVCRWTARETGTICLQRVNGRLQVWLPPGFEQGRKCSVVVFLDGELLPLTADYILEPFCACGNMCRDLVAVGIYTDRDRCDLLRESDPKTSILNDLAQNILPELGQLYPGRLNVSSDVGIVGMSLDGLLALEAVWYASGSGWPFSSAVALSPPFWWDEYDFTKFAASQQSSGFSPAARLFVGKTPVTLVVLLANPTILFDLQELAPRNRPRRLCQILIPSPRLGLKPAFLPTH